VCVDVKVLQLRVKGGGGGSSKRVCKGSVCVCFTAGAAGGHGGNGAAGVPVPRSYCGAAPGLACTEKFSPCFSMQHWLSTALILCLLASSTSQSPQSTASFRAAADTVLSSTL
jgi:hypothetical protein